MNRRSTRGSRPVRSKIVQGKPIRVGERELVPVVRVTAFGRRKAFLGSNRMEAQGWTTVSLRPIAVIERNDTGERLIRIPDRTTQLMGGLLLAAFVIPLLLAVAARLVRK